MIRQPSLYDILLGNFPGGFPLHAANESTQVILFVLDNMRRILNTRADSLRHSPGYGLPDMTRILQSMPGTAHQFISTLSQVLLKYEPRLKGIQITMQGQETPGHLRYSIDAELHDLGIVRYGADFTPEGRILIRHLKKQGWLETGVH